jgi:single-stranded-DNA-specific exonuclease
MSETTAFLGVEQSISGRFWQDRGGNERDALALAQRFGLPEIVGRVLAARGLTVEEADDFLNPSLKSILPDPSDLKDLDRAVQRLADAVAADQNIAIFGDYDVDGATSSAIIYRYFARVSKPPRIYIPDRQKEGYGPNSAALKQLRSDGADVVITVDCGIMAFDALAAGTEAGLDIIVVDHHQAEPRLPNAYAVINPNRVDETFPYNTIAAVGVAFLLLVGLNRELRRRGHFAERDEPPLLQLLDLVALGTVCDVVPLVGLNRVFVIQGLKVLAKRQNPGLAALSDIARMDTKPSAFHLGFLLGPRVNAGGRVGKSDLGARLLTTESSFEAEGLARKLDAFNKERQTIEARVLDEAVEEVESLVTADDPFVLAASDNWHAGVIGIVASRIKDRYHRPTFILSVEGDMAKGSGRSVPGFDLGAAVTAAKQVGLLIAGGGHAMAAGLTVEAGKIPKLRAFFIERAQLALSEKPIVNSLGIDGALQVAGASRDLYDTLEMAGPYGAGHSEPRFVVPRAEIVKATVVGGSHVSIIMANNGKGRLKGIAFRAADQPLGLALLNSYGNPLHIAGHMRADDWQSRRGVQIVIEDAAKPHGG